MNATKILLILACFLVLASPASGYPYGPNDPSALVDPAAPTVATSSASP